MPGGGTTSSASSRNSAAGRSSSCRTAPRSPWAYPFMRAYTELLVKTCHRAAHMPSAGCRPSSRPGGTRRSTATALRGCGRTRGARPAGFDGAWVAHPDLVRWWPRCSPGAGDRPTRRRRRRRRLGSRRGCWTCASPAAVSDAGVRGNVSVALQYLEAWLRGSGAVAINNLMEDAATAEIARAQLWQWIRHATPTESGQPVTLDIVRTMLARARRPQGRRSRRPGRTPPQLLDALVSAKDLPTVSHPGGLSESW